MERSRWVQQQFQGERCIAQLEVETAIFDIVHQIDPLPTFAQDPPASARKGQSNNWLAPPALTR